MVYSSNISPGRQHKSDSIALRSKTDRSSFREKRKRRTGEFESWGFTRNLPQLVCGTNNKKYKEYIYVKKKREWVRGWRPLEQHLVSYCAAFLWRWTMAGPVRVMQMFGIVKTLDCLYGSGLLMLWQFSCCATGPRDGAIDGMELGMRKDEPRRKRRRRRRQPIITKKMLGFSLDGLRHHLESKTLSFFSFSGPSVRAQNIPSLY